jgi:hypothetical protein
LKVLTVVCCDEDNYNCNDLSTLTNLTVLHADLITLHKLSNLTAFNFIQTDLSLNDLTGLTNLKVLKFPHKDNIVMPELLPEPLHSSCEVVLHWDEYLYDKIS